MSNNSEPTNNPSHYDCIMLGGGKGGKSLALALAAKGKKVALIERKMIGGSCINVACIPTKTLVASGKLLHSARKGEADGFGFSTGVGSSAINNTNLKAALARKRAVVDGMVKAHWQLFEHTDNLEFLYGTGTFISAKKIAVELNSGEKREITGDLIFIDTGSRSLIPDYPGLEECEYLTSTSIMELDRLPDRLAIIGGGYIAVEFAQIFARLGSRVTMIERGNTFLPKEDPEIAAELKQLLIDEGVEIVNDATIKMFKRHADLVHLDLGDKGLFECNEVLVATGRIPNTEELNLAAAGIELDKRNFIKVDEYLETTAKGVFAIGDCKGGPFFTHLSWDDYRILRDNVLNNVLSNPSHNLTASDDTSNDQIGGEPVSSAGVARTTTGRIVPYTLFTDPELGRVGMTEAEAIKAGHNILVAKIAARAIPRAQTEIETKGLLKAVIDADTKQILGASILCHAGGEIVSLIQVAMLAKMPYDQLANVMFSHPTMAESLNLLFANVSKPNASH